MSTIDSEFTLQEIYQNGLALVPDLYYTLFFNLIWYMVTGQRFSPKEHNKVRFFSRQALRLLKSIDVTGDAVALTPWLRHFAPKLTGFNDFMQSTANMLKYMEVEFTVNVLLVQTHCQTD